MEYFILIICIGHSHGRPTKKRGVEGLLGSKKEMINICLLLPVTSRLCMRKKYVCSGCLALLPGILVFFACVERRVGFKKEVVHFNL